MNLLQEANKKRSKYELSDDELLDDNKYELSDHELDNIKKEEHSKYELSDKELIPNKSKFKLSGYKDIKQYDDEEEDNFNEETDDKLEDPDEDDDDDELDDIANQSTEDSGRAGVIRQVKGAHLVYKKKDENGLYEELWIFNQPDTIVNNLKTRKAILAGTDIPPNKINSPDNKQSYTIWSVGNIEMLNIKGLPN